MCWMGATEPEPDRPRLRTGSCWSASRTGPAVSEERESASGGAPEPQSGTGFRARKREDHALALIDELRQSLSDPSRVRRILLELGRFYDPVLGGAIMDISHQKQIMQALEAGRTREAESLIEARYALYIKDRIHLGRHDQS